MFRVSRKQLPLTDECICTLMLVKFTIGFCVLSTYACLHRVIDDDIDSIRSWRFQHPSPGDVMFLMVDQHLSQIWYYQGEDVLIATAKLLALIASQCRK